MRKLTSFNFISLDGYLNDSNKDISWHSHGMEENQYAAERLNAGNTLLFGRKTYEMMAAYWPSPEALQNAPLIAESMNNAEKIVVSKTLSRALWNNTTVIKSDLISEITRLKQSEGNDITLLGSGSILTRLAENKLIDEYAIMIDPIALGGGTSIFASIGERLHLKPESVRLLNSGVVLMIYKA